jgi:hypothetical protein
MTLTASDIRRVCVEAECDPRSVQRFLSHRQMKPMTFARVDAALVKLGFKKALYVLRTAKKAAKKGGAS